MQSPIALRINQGLSFAHLPTFTVPEAVNGTFLNWGYGPSFNVHLPTANTWSSSPVSVSFKEDGNMTAETVYLKGWHIHAPADHTVENDRSKAELHLVFGTATGRERAVFAIRVDPGNTESAFFKSIPTPLISYRETTKTVPSTVLNIRQLLSEVNMFSEFWTYRGSLTSPPCTEGIRFYVARSVLYTSNKQMQDILRVCSYSARSEQEVWMHSINV